MRFAEIERVIGAKLPRSAYAYRPWWANETNGHVHAKAWLEAGFETAQVDMAGKKLTFRRMSNAKPTPGSELNEANHMYKHEGSAEARHHPLVGCMKGTVTVMPGVDLTQPALPPDEWEEILQESLRNWDDLLRSKPEDR